MSRYCSDIFKKHVEQPTLECHFFPILIYYCLSKCAYCLLNEPLLLIARFTSAPWITWLVSTQFLGWKRLIFTTWESFRHLLLLEELSLLQTWFDGGSLWTNFDSFLSFCSSLLSNWQQAKFKHPLFSLTKPIWPPVAISNWFLYLKKHIFQSKYVSTT